MVGTAPSTGTSTTVKVFMIPIALKYVASGVTTVFSPETIQSNGASAVTNTVNSPIFKNMAWVTPQGTSLWEARNTKTHSSGATSGRRSRERTIT